MASEAVAIERTLGPLATQHGLELWTVEMSGTARRPLVRVSLDKPGGVTCDDLTDANRWISDALDALGRPAGPYVLEVSSPGIERPLRGPADYVRYRGDKAEVKLREPLDGRKTFTGTIAAADETGVTLDVDGTQVRLAHDTIAKGRLRADFDLEIGKEREPRP